MYAAHFPVTESNPDLCKAMAIAMGYVRGAGLADHLLNLTVSCSGNLNAWELGIRHPIALANAGRYLCGANGKAWAPAGSL